MEECNSSTGTAIPRGADEVGLITVIRTKSLIGVGSIENPCRYIYQYWNINGELLASHDTLGDSEKS